MDGAFFIDRVNDAGSYTLLAVKIGYMTNWVSGTSARGSVMIGMPENQLLSFMDTRYTATVVLTWGKQSTHQTDYDAFLGTPRDLDLWVQFEVAETGEMCLINYAAPMCGNAELILTDELCCVEVRGLKPCPDSSLTNCGCTG